MRHGLTIGVAPDFKMFSVKIQLTHAASIQLLCDETENNRQDKISDLSLWNLARTISEKIPGFACSMPFANKFEKISYPIARLLGTYGEIRIHYLRRNEVNDRQYDFLCHEFHDLLTRFLPRY